MMVNLFFVNMEKSPDRYIANIQSFINPIWGIIFGGCNINRNIPKIIHDGDFKIDSMEQMYLPGTPKFVGYNYWGVAKNEHTCCNWYQLYSTKRFLR
jgi:hypothetical protein